MGTAKQPADAKLFLAVMYSNENDYNLVIQKFCELYGKSDNEYGPINFSYTTYYDKEMGSDIKKIYLTFENKIQRDKIADVKNFTNSLESSFAQNGNRTVNLDPGYITRDKLILATTKDFYHRVYLKDGIYGEVTLHFGKKNFRFFSWTYQDYKEPKFMDFIRNIYKTL